MTTRRIPDAEDWTSRGDGNDLSYRSLYSNQVIPPTARSSTGESQGFGGAGDRTSSMVKPSISLESYPSLGPKVSPHCCSRARRMSNVHQLVNLMKDYPKTNENTKFQHGEREESAYQAVHPPWRQVHACHVGRL